MEAAPSPAQADHQRTPTAHVSLEAALVAASRLHKARRQASVVPEPAWNTRRVAPVDPGAEVDEGVEADRITGSMMTSSYPLPWRRVISIPLEGQEMLALASDRAGLRKRKLWRELGMNVYCPSIALKSIVARRDTNDTWE